MEISAPFLSSLHLQGFEPDRMREVIRGARFEHYLLAPTLCEARLNRWSLDDFSVDVGRYNFPVLVVGAFPAQRLCVGYMRHQQSPTWVSGLTADQTTMEFYPAGTELNYRAAPGGEWVAMEFSEASIQAAAVESLGHPLGLPWRQVASLKVSAAERSALDDMVDLLWNHPVSGTLMVQPILRQLAAILDSQHGTPGHRAAAASQAQQRQTILRRSVEHLRRYPDNAFRLEDLATASGATVRTLQRVFQEAYGLTPQHWARCLALHRARGILRSPGTRVLTVQSVAHSCGFRHMGRFSEYYHDLFGELPSATLSAER
jgi:AraC-like DNA-binding protein